MSPRLSWWIAAQQIGEFGLFWVGLVLALRATPDVSLSMWQWMLAFGVVFCLLGAVPCPWERRVSLVAVGAFLPALGILGYIDWRMEYFLMFEHEGAWANLPRVLLGWQNVAVATCLSGGAVLGFVASRSLRGGRRRTSG